MACVGWLRLLFRGSRFGWWLGLCGGCRFGRRVGGCVCLCRVWWGRWRRVGFDYSASTKFVVSVCRVDLECYLLIFGGLLIFQGGGLKNPF